MAIRIDLNYDINSACKKKCNRSQRKKLTRDDLCSEINSVYDNLPLRCVGKWGMQKIYFLIQYFGIFSIGMKNKWELNYIEIGSGPGRCIDRSNGQEFDGTSMSIVQHKAFENINKALFFDVNQNIVDTLNERLSKLNINGAKAVLGDYTQPDLICESIKEKVNPYSLNICFIDPTDCSVPFILIKKIKEILPNVDFIINLASGTDFNRNIKNAILQENFNLQLKYSKFLGSKDFFKDSRVNEYAKGDKSTELRNFFREYYKKSMEKLGYEYFDFKKIQHYYDILFATASKKGLEFWKKATKINFDGQREIF